MQIGSNSSERIRIQSDGKIGIGRTSPVNFIDIHRGQDEENILVVRGQGLSDEYIALGVNGSDAILTAGGVSGNNTNLVFRTSPNGNETERMHIHSNGAVSIGTDDSARSFTLFNAVSSDVMLRIKNDINNEDTGLEIHYNGSSSTRTFRMGGRVIADNDDMQYTTSQGARFYVNSSTEAININANARVMHTSADNTMVQSSIAGAVRMQLTHTGGGDVTFSNPSSGSATYSTSSDYRLKQDVVALPNALTTVKALKPYQYTWKHDPSKTSQGFFAHEVLETVPNAQAASGTKDAVYSEDDVESGVKAGDPIYQQIDYSKLVPLLTAALQEEISKRESLEARVAALEAA